MNLNATAASMGLKLLSGALQNPETLSSLGNIAKQAGKLVGGSEFAKVAEAFHLPTGLGKKIGQFLEGDDKPAAPVTSVNTNATQLYLNYFDLNRDGNVSKDELSQGVASLEKSGLGNRGVFNRLQQTGAQLLSHYDAVAKLDGSAGISRADIAKLAGKDGSAGQLATTDWNQWNA